MQGLSRLQGKEIFQKSSLEISVMLPKANEPIIQRTYLYRFHDISSHWSQRAMAGVRINSQTLPFNKPRSCIGCSHQDVAQGLGLNASALLPLPSLCAQTQDGLALVSHLSSST